MVRGGRTVVLLLGLALALVAAPSASAVDFAVDWTNNEQDGGPGAGADGKLSLREAFAAANIDRVDSGIFLPPGAYHLNTGPPTGQLEYSEAHLLRLAGQGPRSTIIDGDLASRILKVSTTNSP